MKNLSIRIARLLGSIIGKRLGEKLIVFIFKITDVSILRIAYRQYGLIKFQNMRVSGESGVLEKIVKPNLLPNEVLIDVGANIGEYTKELSRVFPSSRIISVEANPITYEILKQNVETEAYNYAVSEVSGIVDFFTSEENASSTQASLSMESVPNNETLSKISVHSIRLDELLKDKEVAQIGLLKVDTEGHDLGVLKSCQSYFTQIKFVQFEFNEKYVYTRTFLKDFYQILHETHLIYRIDTDRLHDLTNYDPVYEIFRYQNLLAVRKDLQHELERLIKIQKSH